MSLTIDGLIVNRRGRHYEKWLEKAELSEPTLPRFLRWLLLWPLGLILSIYAYSKGMTLVELNHKLFEAKEQEQLQIKNNIGTPIRPPKWTAIHLNGKTCYVHWVTFPIGSFLTHLAVIERNGVSVYRIGVFQTPRKEVKIVKKPFPDYKIGDFSRAKDWVDEDADFLALCNPLRFEQLQNWHATNGFPESR
jgi:hypothetical protein